MPTFNIISIDGGGLRGIVPLRILQKVVEIWKEKHPNDELLDFTDMYSGTSTGGLLTCCITMGDDKNPTKPKYSLQDIADIYINDGATIFPIRTDISKFFHDVKGYFAPEYSPDGINKVLSQYAGTEKRIKDSLRPILVSTYDLNGNRPVFFKTAEASDNPSANARVFDVCRATSAAPTYLPAYQFEHKGEKLLGIDGGVYVNNPTMASLAEISHYGASFGPKSFYKKRDGSPVEYNDVRILSLGTGSYNGRVTEKDAVSWGKIAWVQSIIDIMMAGVNQTTNFEGLEMVDPGRHLRLDITIPDKQYSEMDDARPETREYLEGQIKKQVTENEGKLKELRTFLNSIS